MRKKEIKNIYVNQVIRSFAEERVLKQEYVAGPLNKDLYDLGEYCYHNPEKNERIK